LNPAKVICIARVRGGQGRLTQPKFSTRGFGETYFRKQSTHARELNPRSIILHKCYICFILVTIALSCFLSCRVSVVDVRRSVWNLIDYRLFSQCANTDRLGNVHNCIALVFSKSLSVVIIFLKIRLNLVLLMEYTPRANAAAHFYFARRAP
jgi:hypothetical protein